jgi:hypothetical protein
MLSDKLTDLDYTIMGVLPAHGTRLGYHTYAKQVMSIVEELGGVKSAQVSGRLPSLKYYELVTSVVVQPVSKGFGWQVTEQGLKLLSEHSHDTGATIHHLPTHLPTAMRREGA